MYAPDMKAAHAIITAEIKRCHGLDLTAEEYFYGPDFYDIRDYSLAMHGVDADGLFRRTTVDDEHYVAMLYGDSVVAWSWAEPHNPWKFAVYPAREVMLGNYTAEKSVIARSPLDWLRYGGICYVS